mgnify:CR=1 FL=1
MNYNIMADSLSYHNKEKTNSFENKYLDWELRAQTLVREILYYDPDIVGLQEVDKVDTLL